MASVRIPALLASAPTSMLVTDSSGSVVAQNIGLTEVQTGLYLSDLASVSDTDDLTAVFLGPQTTARFQTRGGIVMVPALTDSRILKGTTGQTTSAKVYKEADGSLVETLTTTEIGNGVYKAAEPSTSTVARYYIVHLDEDTVPVDVVWCQVGMSRNVPVHIELTEGGVPLTGVLAQAVDTDTDALDDEGTTNAQGKVTLGLMQGSYKLVLSSGSKVFSENVIDVEIDAQTAHLGSSVVVSKSLTTTTPTFTPVLGLASSELATISMTVVGVDGSSRADLLVVAKLDRPVVSSTAISDTVVTTRTGADGAASFTVVKDTPFTVYVEGQAPRRFSSGVSEDTSLLDGGVADTMSPTSALPALTATT